MLNANHYAVQKYMFEILQDRYAHNQQVIERVSHALVTQQDLNDWGRLVVDLFEMGYLKATEQYKEQMAKMGYDVKIVPGTRE